MKQIDQIKHPRGKGQRFIDRTYSTPEVSLAWTKKPSLGDVAGRDYGALIRSSDRRVSDAASAEFLARMKCAVSWYGRKRGLNADDIEDAVGDALVDLTRNYLVRGAVIEHGLIRMRASSIVSQYLNGPMRHEESKALKIFEEKRDAIESADGRLLTDMELDALAATVRGAADSRHRPKVGFHRDSFLHPTVNADYDEIREMEEAGAFSAEGQQIQPDPAVDVTLDRIEQQRPAYLREHRYALYAEAFDMPQPLAGRIPKELAVNVIAHLGDRVSAVAETYLEDNVYSRDVKALFAPFVDLTPSTQAKLARAFSSQPQYAKELWLSAMHAATGRRTTRADRLAAAQLPHAYVR